MKKRTSTYPLHQPDACGYAGWGLWGLESNLGNISWEEAILLKSKSNQIFIVVVGITGRYTKISEQHCDRTSSAQGPTIFLHNTGWVWWNPALSCIIHWRAESAPKGSTLNLHSVCLTVMQRVLWSGKIPVYRRTTIKKLLWAISRVLRGSRHLTLDCILTFQLGGSAFMFKIPTLSRQLSFLGWENNDSSSLPPTLNNVLQINVFIKQPSKESQIIDGSFPFTGILASILHLHN